MLAVATVGLVVLAVLNFRQESRVQQPDDGVWWREAAGGLEAVKVLPNSPGQRAGIQEHDLLTGAEVLPGTAGLRSGMQSQDLLSEEKTLPTATAPQNGSQAKKPLPGKAGSNLPDRFDDSGA